MKHILILLLMLAAFPGQADNTPADGDSQSADSASKSENGKKPKQGDEEEPDCD